LQSILNIKSDYIYSDKHNQQYFENTFYMQMLRVILTFKQLWVSTNKQKCQGSDYRNLDRMECVIL
jgi:hypothetical protein